MKFTFGANVFDFSLRTHVMGILNVTPDSFSDGGLHAETEQAIVRALQMVEEGADIIDIGGESTKPGAEEVSLDEELRRVIPVIEQLTGRISVPISIDTKKAEVAAQALSAGASIVNDITGLQGDPKMAETVARHGASVVLMHIQGTPQTMQQRPRYENIIEDICAYLEESIHIAKAHGIAQIILDPGIGFGKTLEHNLTILRELKAFQRFQYPLLIGLSRKSFIGKLLDLSVEQRLEGTSAGVAVAVMNGANIVRVHDIKEIKRVVTIVDAVLKPKAIH